MKLNDDDDMKEPQQNKGLKMIVNFLVSAPNHLVLTQSLCECSFVMRGIFLEKK